MAVDKAYFQELARQAGLDPDVAAGLEKALENDKFATSLGNSVSRQTDYSRNMDSLKQQQQQLETQRKELAEWQQGIIAADQQREQELQSLRNGNGDPNRSFDPTKYVAVDDLQKRLEEAQARGINISSAIAKDGIKCGLDYYSRFGKLLDVDAVEKYAVENRVTVQQAYNAVIAPEVQAKQEAEFAAKLEAARKEGYTEAVSKHGLPVEAAKSEPHMLYEDLNRTPEQRAELSTTRSRLSSFKDAWEGYQAGTAPKL